MISKNAHPGEGARTELRSRGRAARSGRRGYPPSHRRGSPALLAGLAIALIIGAMVLARVFLVGRGGEAERQPAPPSVVQALGAIPADVTSQIGRGTAQGSPIAVNGPPLTGPRGLPEVLYVGAEYCPYCAAERWALVVALSRFGTFQNLQLARSAADDVYPSTPTFSFYGATYQSPYLEFRAVELQSSARVEAPTRRCRPRPRTRRRSSLSTTVLPTSRQARPGRFRSSTSPTATSSPAQTSVPRSSTIAPGSRSPRV